MLIIALNQSLNEPLTRCTSALVLRHYGRSRICYAGSRRLGRLGLVADTALTG